MPTGKVADEELVAYVGDVARRYGANNWNAIDMAIHTKKYVAAP